MKATFRRSAPWRCPHGYTHVVVVRICPVYEGGKRVTNEVTITANHKCHWCRVNMRYYVDDPSSAIASADEHPEAA